MALTFSIVKKNVKGASREAIVDVTFDSSYPTGGESFTVSDVDPMATSALAFDFVDVSSRKVPASNDFYYDYTNKLLMAFVITTGVQVADTTDLSAAVCRCKVSYGQVS